MKVFIKGLNSCTMRKQNIQHYREVLSDNGHIIVKDPAKSDVIIVWTCAFRGDVLENSLSELVRYRKEYSARIVITGCLPDIAPGRLGQHIIGRIIPWKDEASEFEEYFNLPHGSFHQTNPIFIEKAACDHAGTYRKEHPETDVTFHDQFVKLLVAEGCPFECTYCSERLAFPTFRSFPEEELVEACRQIVEETGQTRVMLLADCLGEYGRGIGSSLPILIRKLRTVHPELTFALNNLHPASFLRYSDELLHFISDGWICHLNLPIQSASDHVLKLMNREYTRKDLKWIFSTLQEADFYNFDTHIIVGFPGETNEDFEMTVRFLIWYHPTYVLISEYFEARNAPSVLLPDTVDKEEVRDCIRWARIQFQNFNIHHNWEGSALIKERFRRLNQVR